MHEAALHEVSAFVTLTYSPEHYPAGGSLSKRELQLFFKKLRKSIYPRRFRYYACGEYGSDGGRPHYHALIFGYDWPDKAPIPGQDGRLWRSESLDRVWGLGYCWIGSVTFDSAGYVARYISKKVFGDLAEAHYRRVDLNTGELVQVLPEFSLMSRKPGIGSGWLKRYASEVYPSDEVIAKGRPMKPPLFYDRVLKKEDPVLYRKVKVSRISDGATRKNRANSTPERLAVREEVTAARVSNQMTRDYE